MYRKGKILGTGIEVKTLIGLQPFLIMIRKNYAYVWSPPCYLITSFKTHAINMEPVIGTCTKRLDTIISTAQSLL